MGETCQRGHRRLYQPVAGCVVKARDQPETAAVAFVGIFVESAVLSVHAWALALIGSGRQARAAEGKFRGLKTSRQFVRSGDPQDLDGPRMSSQDRVRAGLPQASGSTVIHRHYDSIIPAHQTLASAALEMPPPGI